MTIDNILAADWTTEAGYRALVLGIFCWKKGVVNHYCGYVAVPDTHPTTKTVLKEEYQKLLEALTKEEAFLYMNKHSLSVYSVVKASFEDLSVHGGVTYDSLNSPIKAMPEEGLFWIGFDCAHSGDRTASSLNGIFRDVDFCKAECESLAKQLKALA